MKGCTMIYNCRHILLLSNFLSMREKVRVRGN